MQRRTAAGSVPRSCPRQFEKLQGHEGVPYSTGLAAGLQGCTGRIDFETD